MGWLEGDLGELGGEKAQSEGRPNASAERCPSVVVPFVSSFEVEN